MGSIWRVTTASNQKPYAQKIELNVEFLIKTFQRVVWLIPIFGEEKSSGLIAGLLKQFLKFKVCTLVLSFHPSTVDLAWAFHCQSTSRSVSPRSFRPSTQSLYGPPDGRLQLHFEFGGHWSRAHRTRLWLAPSDLHHAPKKSCFYFIKVLGHAWP